MSDQAPPIHIITEPQTGSEWLVFARNDGQWQVTSKDVRTITYTLTDAGLLRIMRGAS